MTSTEPLRPDQREDHAKLSPVRPAQPSPVRPALCTHVMTSGNTCGSPAVSGTALCYHHSEPKLDNSACPPIPFVFPADRPSLQMNYFLLIQAFTDGRINLRTFNSIQRLLRAMDINLGKMTADDFADSVEPPAAATEALESVPAKQAAKKPAHSVATNTNPPQPLRPKPASKPYPSFEAIAAKLKPLSAECFLNIPSLTNSLNC